MRGVAHRADPLVLRGAWQLRNRSGSCLNNLSGNVSWGGKSTWSVVLLASDRFDDLP